MRNLSLIAGMAVFALPSALIAATDGAPPRQPGSWTHTITIKRMEGPGATEARPMLEAMFASVSKTSVCMTPEMAASEDPLGNVSAFAGDGSTCTWTRRTVIDGHLDLAGTCKDPSGALNRISATGTMTATDRDVDLTIDGAKVDGTPDKLLQIRVHAVRNGACTAADAKEPLATS